MRGVEIPISEFRRSPRHNGERIEGMRRIELYKDIGKGIGVNLTVRLYQEMNVVFSLVFFSVVVNEGIEADCSACYKLVKLSDEELGCIIAYRRERLRSLQDLFLLFGLLI